MVHEERSLVPRRDCTWEGPKAERDVAYGLCGWSPQSRRIQSDEAGKDGRDWNGKGLVGHNTC